MSKLMTEVHIVEADPGVAEVVMELLENQFQVKIFSALTEFLEQLLNPAGEKRPDLILCDAKLHDEKGLEILRFVRRVDSSVPFIFMVNHPSPTWIRAAYRSGVTDLLEKPFASFTFIDQFSGRIEQAKVAQKQARMIELLELQCRLTTTHVNRLVDRTAISGQKKLRYAAPDEDQISFSHAGKSEEKLLNELEQCRIEYLTLAQDAESP